MANSTLTIERRGMMRSKAPCYDAMIEHTVVETGTTKDEAKAKAYAALVDAWRNVSNLSSARTAKDGTVIIVRVIGSLDQRVAQVEYNRDGNSGSVCVGLMTNGIVTFASTREYCDYLLAQYES